MMAAIPDLRNAHDSLCKSFCDSMGALGVDIKLLNVHDAVHTIRTVLDPEFTDKNWAPILPGDNINPKISKTFTGDIAELLWPSLSHQIIPRDAKNLDLHTVKIGGTIYSSVFIDLFPKDVQPFMVLFNRTLPNRYLGVSRFWLMVVVCVFCKSNAPSRHYCHSLHPITV